VKDELYELEDDYCVEYGLLSKFSILWVVLISLL